MRLNSFLLSEGRAQSISQKKAIELLAKNCSESIDLYENHRVEFNRGSGHSAWWLFIEPSLTYRKVSSGVGSYMYYQHLMDELPEWQSYPKRSRSVMAFVNSYNAAGLFGNNIHTMFPFNGANLGVCKTGDIWREQAWGYHLHLTTLAPRLANLFDIVGADKKAAEKDYWSLRQAMMKVDEYGKDKLKKELIDRRNDVEYWIQCVPYLNPNIHVHDDLLTVIREVMDPKAGKFKNLKLGQITAAYKEAEIWTDSPCVMVLPEIMSDMLSYVEEYQSKK